MPTSRQSKSDMKIQLSLEELCSIIGSPQADVCGETAIPLTGIAALADAQPGDLSFLGNRKYTPEVDKCLASYLLLPTDYVGTPKSDQVFIRVKNPSYALALVCAHFEQQIAPSSEPGIHSSAVVADSAKIGKGVILGPHVVIQPEAVVGDDVRLDANAYVGYRAEIGAHCWLKPNAVVHDFCILQERVILHSGVVVGSDGFGYETVDGNHLKVPQIGNVIIEEDVEIGAGTTIDRARFNSTVIGAGSKIDNLVQIAHNVKIGKNCLVAAQAGISGSTLIGDRSVIAGQAGITGHLLLGEGTIVGAQCGLHYNTEPGTYHRGSPGNPASLANKIDVLRKRLPELFKKVDKLESQISCDCKK